MTAIFSRRPKPSLIAAALVVTCAAAPSALANDWYVKGAAGLVFQGDEDGLDVTTAATALSTGTTLGADASFDSGFSFGGGIGRWFSERWRADVDFTYRSVDNDEFVLSDGRVVNDGNYASTALSINGYYHFGEPRQRGAFSPYVGAGLVYINEIDIDLEGSGLGGGAIIEDLEDDGVGVQLIGGVSWQQTDRLRWEAEARYLPFGDVDLEDEAGNRISEIGYDPFSLYVGVSFGF